MAIAAIVLMAVAFKLTRVSGRSFAAEPWGTLLQATNPDQAIPDITLLPNGTIGANYEFLLGDEPLQGQPTAEAGLPPGLKLRLNPLGISGTPLQSGEFSFAVIARTAGQVTARRYALFVLPALDQYGGVAGGPCPGGRKAHFYVNKIGHRWLLCTPDGNQMWLMSVYHVNTDATTDAQRKYAGVENWGKAQVIRLKAWGFNAVAPYSDYRAWDRVPTFHLANGTHNAMANRWNLAPGPTKNLFAGLNRRYLDASWGFFADVFDPNFEAYWRKFMAEDMPGLRPVYASPYLLGIGTDDRDFLTGFGPGLEVPNCCPHPHLARLVLLTSPTQTTARNDLAGQITYSDTKVYSKFALRDFMKSRYGSIDQLNQAWGAKYTTWDSAGGWGAGSGFLDEDGRHSWAGKDETALTDVTAAMRGDLDDFLYQVARRYFAVSTGAIRDALGNNHVLIFGPSAFNTYGITFKPILKAAGEYCDVVQATVDGGLEVLRKTYEYTGRKPLVTWEAAVANPDSAMWRHPFGPNKAATSSQAARGKLYAKTILGRFNANDTGTGDYPIAGFAFWELRDNRAEQANFGLVSLLDNAYDGRESVTTAVKCEWPLQDLTCGGEERNYGDFITEVRRTNLKIMQSLSAAQAKSGPSQPSRR